MSIWYDITVTAMAKDSDIGPVAKFFNLDNDFKDVRTDTFKFSFGGKNTPSLALAKIVKQNPDLIFLVKVNIECATEQWFLTRYDLESGEQQYVLIQDFGDVENRISENILKEYEKAYPGLMAKHLNGQEGFEAFRWTMFFSFNNSKDILDKEQDYRNNVDPWEYYKIKMYSVEYDCDYGDNELHHQVYGPVSFGEANRMIRKHTKSVADGFVKNVVLTELDFEADPNFDNLPLENQSND